MKIIIHWLILTLAIMSAPYVVPGIHVNGFLTAVIVAAILGFLNMTVKPIVTLLTLPITIITLGLFSLVINALFFWFVATLVPSFSVANFIAAFWGALAVSVINWIMSKVFGNT